MDAWVISPAKAAQGISSGVSPAKAGPPKTPPRAADPQSPVPAAGPPPTTPVSVPAASARPKGPATKSGREAREAAQQLAATKQV